MAEPGYNGNRSPRHRNRSENCPAQIASMAMRFSLALIRTSLHAAVVLSFSVALVLLFALWSLFQLFDETAVR